MVVGENCKSTLDDAVNEVKALLSVGLHENIVWCLGAEFWEPTNTFHIVFEHVQGLLSLIFVAHH